MRSTWKYVRQWGPKRAGRWRKYNNDCGTEKDDFIKLTVSCEESVSRITSANRQVITGNEDKICSAAENNPMVFDGYEEGAEREAIEREDSVGDGDRSFELLDLNVGTNATTPRKKDYKTRIRKKIWEKTEISRLCMIRRAMLQIRW